jgi:hypothetical protein
MKGAVAAVSKGTAALFLSMRPILDPPSAGDIRSGMRTKCRLRCPGAGVQMPSPGCYIS